MVQGRDKEELSAIEAITILTNMSEIDLKEPTSFEEEEGVYGVDIDWKDPKQALQNEDIVKECFSTLHKYLQKMVRKDRSTLNDPQIQKGIQALVAIAREAAHKMDRFTALYPEKYKPISKLKEYQDLQKYYRQQIRPELSLPGEPTEDWEENLEEELQEVSQEKAGLKNLDAVRKDHNYELFFIKNEDNRPYFSKTLIRHVRLLGNFDELLAKAEGEDPLLRLREMLDFELYEGAKEAIQQLAPYLDPFYKEGMQHKGRPYEGNLNKATMALRMAANPKNLIESQSFKCCLEYYADFHRFLRQVLHAPRYLKSVAGELNGDPYPQGVLRLTHAMCAQFFLRREPRKEALKLIYDMVARGKKMKNLPQTKKKSEDPLQIWANFALDDECLRYLAAHYPNGPLLRTLDMFREEEEYEGYDPLMHYNFPAQLFSFKLNDKHITLMRLPCPVRQVYIQKAEIVEEFKGFLRFLKKELGPDKHLLINLQDRTSWQEIARVKEIESLALDSEFYETFFTLGLAQATPFALQQDGYQMMAGAPVFMEQLEEQILGGHECGFHLPEMVETKKIKAFLKKTIPFIHEAFFEKKETLTQPERLVFVDITHLLLTLKTTEWLNVDSISFTCKDAIDVGIAYSAMLFGLLRLLKSQKPFTEDEIDLLYWMLYSPALLIRERPIQHASFNKALNTLQTLHAAFLNHPRKVADGIEELVHS